MSEDPKSFDYRQKLREAIDRQSYALKISLEEIAKPESNIYDDVINAAVEATNSDKDLVVNEVQQTIEDWKVLLDAAYSYLDLTHEKQ